MMLRRLAALVALPVLALSLVAAPAMAAAPEPAPPPVIPGSHHVWICTDPDISVNLGDLLNLEIDLGLFHHHWNGLYCGWARVK